MTNDIFMTRHRTISVRLSDEEVGKLVKIGVTKYRVKNNMTQIIRLLIEDAEVKDK